MRIVIVNHCHPDCPHVCGTRAREFAAALARQGHRVVLLTETLRRDDPGTDVVALPSALAAYDWAQPFRLAVRPKAAPVLEALRAGRLPAPLRAVIIAWQYLVRGGMFTDWRDASHVYWRPLAETFRPDIVWGIFGNTDAWAIARGIARSAGSPWVRDFKDQWTAFIPVPLRGFVAQRYSQAAATTGLSQANLDDAAVSFSRGGTVVYSGLPADYLSGAPIPGAAEPAFRLTLVGAIYDRKLLGEIAGGIQRFLAARDRGAVCIAYVGTDIEAVRDAFRTVNVALDLRGQLPFAGYWQAIAASHANIYARVTRQGWWHHKLVELLAVQRPILCCPGEIDEARRLTRSVGGRLEEASDAAAVAAALDRLWSERNSPHADQSAAVAALSWAERARELHGVFQMTVASAGIRPAQPGGPA